MDTTFWIIIAVMLLLSCASWSMYEEFRRKRAQEQRKPEKYKLI